MPKLPVVTPRRLLKALQSAGVFMFITNQGSHVNLRHTLKSHLHIVIPIHSRDLAPKTLKSIMIQAEMTVDELRSLL
jgi:predicted RNA binding protein YcfA (HicA-like mRNA interferase family)